MQTKGLQRPRIRKRNDKFEYEFPISILLLYISAVVIQVCIHNLSFPISTILLIPLSSLGNSSPSGAAKLKCMLHYFNKITQRLFPQQGDNSNFQWRSDNKGKLYLRPFPRTQIRYDSFLPINLPSLH